MLSTPSISVIIPAYNEEKIIFDTLGRISSYLTKHFEFYEIIVVDDGSKDMTFEMAIEFKKLFSNIRILRNQTNRGQGYSIKKGFFAANGEWILCSDADLSTPIGEIKKLIAWIHSGFDLAFGSRKLPGSLILLRQPFYRELMSRAFNLIVRATVLPGVMDTQCGFKLFKREVVNQFVDKMTTDGFCFNVELLFLARKSGLKIKEVPIKWYDNPESSVRLCIDSIQMFLDLFRIRRRHQE